MCGRYSIYESMDHYLRQLSLDLVVINGYDHEPISRFNVAPSTRVEVIRRVDEGLSVDRVKWGWSPFWAKGKRPNREIALLSHVFTMAMEWDFAERNPYLAVRRNKEKVRDFYAADESWDAVYAEGDQGLKDAMDLAYLAGQRPADTLKFSTVDLDEDYLWVDQNKTDKKLRIRRHINGELIGLGLFIEALLERRKLHGVRNSRLITNDSGLRMSWEMLRNRFSEARDKAARKLTADGNTDLATKVRQFQFRDIRPKAASEIEDINHASRLLGHSKEEITKRVYRRVGEVVSPTK
ncbi:SOS response-associated peptidase family protein [Pseudomonas asiatica]|uniref:SOS response-associated peptidase family protein n=1 Tax=Pseudomonas asiatica TaxID=2219225 RepID=A0ABU5L4P3_9PSED|nr:SOS response-associated peptidase family protein [Pseudomonas asiatica]MDZ5741025.1 SOS response-associated peptidase family protein [Pseudomonas asiatica]MDZ5745926.1 SOS response-associated peptidase family protein [Pseudomonas asiatica]MDZ5750520.1 SOS response-associated peptidase family protein [Pseudomonas asiatica]MDZ5756402.1 SOS response-associated peptidase family protein [Pseudomonas asiatica]